MSDPSARPPGSYDDRRRQLQQDLAAKQVRRQQSRMECERSALTGLALFGIVGWSVVTPMLLGLMVGIWLDGRWPTSWSWTLMLLLLGLALGCLNAWFWIEREQKR